MPKVILLKLDISVVKWGKKSPHPVGLLLLYLSQFHINTDSAVTGKEWNVHTHLSKNSVGTYAMSKMSYNMFNGFAA